MVDQIVSHDTFMTTYHNIKHKHSKYLIKKGITFEIKMKLISIIQELLERKISKLSSQIEEADKLQVFRARRGEAILRYLINHLDNGNYSCANTTAHIFFFRIFAKVEESARDKRKLVI